MLRRLGRGWPFAFGVAALLALGFGTYLVVQAELKLSRLVLGGLGESFSTRVWSAPHLLRDGALGDAETLIERLERLHYRRVDSSSAPAKGEYRWEAPTLEVHLRGFANPLASQAEGLYTLRRSGAGAWSLFQGEASVSELRLEPELAAELSGERGQRREPATWEQLPRELTDAVVAAEDKRFWSHHGLDPRGMARALLNNLRGRELQGASTITQQLSKNLFLSPRRTLKRKLAEAALAVYLELRLSKERILAIYLNHIYLGQDGASSVMGARSAARHYFGKDLAELTLAECATIAGVIRGPGVYSPFRDAAAARGRRDHVLRRMRDDGLITPERHDAAAAEPLVPVRGAPAEEKRDTAYYAAEVVRQLVPRYGGEALNAQGLQIHTAMDPLLQSAAQKTLRGAKHQAALAAVDPRDGAVLALAGGKDFGQSQFNRATQALRQPGSAFKPFVFAAALAQGMTPATVLADKPRSWPGQSKEWSPANYDDVYLGTASVRVALARSLNQATLDLASKVGVKRIEETARACGVTSPLRGDLGLALGASEVGLLELTAAYAPFANGGLRVMPRVVTAVVDAEGAMLETAFPDTELALDPAHAFLMGSLLETVVQEGTARSLKDWGVTFPVAGKTGTTNEGRDAWFVGFYSNLAAGVWVGDDQNRALKLTGAKDALPLWASFMKRAVADRPAEPLARPDRIVEVLICLDSGQKARSGCVNRRSELFVAGTEPSFECELHRGGVRGWLKRIFGR